MEQNEWIQVGLKGKTTKKQLSMRKSSGNSRMTNRYMRMGNIYSVVPLISKKLIENDDILLPVWLLMLKVGNRRFHYDPSL